MTGLKLVLPEKRLNFNIMREKAAIETLMTDLPDDEIVKLLSFGVFSSIGFIRFVADREIIKNLDVSTFAVGANQSKALDVMADDGRILNARFFVGTIMEMDAMKKRAGINVADRAQALDALCKKHSWNYYIVKNHSKIILFNCASGKYVLETSSNLNENPKFEQYSFEKNEALYNFYIKFFDGLEDGLNGETQQETTHTKKRSPR